MATEYPYPRRPLPTLRYSDIALGLYTLSLLGALVYLFFNPFWGLVLLIFSVGMLAVNIQTRMKLIESRAKVRDENFESWMKYREIPDLQEDEDWEIEPPYRPIRGDSTFEDWIFKVGDVISDFAAGKQVCPKCGYLHERSQGCSPNPSSQR